MTPADDARRPYPGLRPFEAGEADLFFGREVHVDALLQRLSNSHFVAVVGESGAGKSSLVRAGLLPALEAGFVVEAGSDWRVALLRPGGAPLSELVDALLAKGVLSKEGGVPQREFALAELRRGPLGLVQLVRDARLGDYCNTLIVVDQFEELFRFCREPLQKDQANIFVELLLNASKQRQVPIFVVLTMRSDFVGECARFRGLPEMLNDNQFLTPRLTRDEIAGAIREPARVHGGIVDDDLVDELCNAVGDDQDQLPLLQHLLMRLWEEASGQPGPPAVDGRRSPWPRLTSQGLTLTGNLQTALNNHAQQIYDALSPDRRDVARMLFRSLTDPHSQRRDSRRDALVSDVSAIAGVGTATVISVADEFRAEGRHLLMPPPAVALSADSRLDVSHESLLRQWSSLAGWAREEATIAREFSRLRDEAHREDAGQGELLSGRALVAAQDWLKQAAPTPAWAERYATPGELDTTVAFIHKSEDRETQRRDQELRAARREREATRAKKLSAVLLGAVLIAAVVTAVILVLWRGSEAQRHRADAQAAIATSNEAKATASATTATTLAAEIAREKATVDQQNKDLGEQSKRAHTSQLTANALLARDKDPSLAVLLAREAVLEGEKDDSALQSLRAAIGDHVQVRMPAFPVAKARNYIKGSDKRQWLDFSLSAANLAKRGDLAVIPSGEASIIWSTRTGKALRTLPKQDGIVGAAIFSPDGSLIVTTGADRTARIWNTAAAAVAPPLRHSGMVNAAAFNRDGKVLITLADRGDARVWDVGTYDKPRCQLEALGEFVEATFSHDQKLVVTLLHLGDSEWNAQVWDLGRSGCPETSVKALDDIKKVQWASFSPYGPWLGVVSETGGVTILDTSTWTIKRTLAPGVPYGGNDEDSGRSGPPRLAWSSDGKYVAFAGNDHIVRIASIEKNDATTELQGHTGRITSIAFHPTGDVLLTTSTDRTARVWKLDGEKQLRESLTLKGHEDTVGSAAFTPDGSEIVTAGDEGKVRVWKPTFTSLDRPFSNLRGVSYATDGSRIWISGVDRRIQSGRLLMDGYWISALTPGTLVTRDDELKFKSVSDLAFYGPIVAERSAAKSIVVRDLRRPAQLLSLTDSDRVPQDSKIAGASPSGRYFYAKGNDSVLIWDATAPASQTSVKVPPAEKGKYQPQAVSDQKQMAWYCAEGDLILVTRPDQSQPVRVHVSQESKVQSSRFSSSGGWLAIVLEDYSLQVIDTRSGAVRSTMHGHTGDIKAVDFSGDAFYLVSVSADSTVRTWDVETGTLIGSLSVKDGARVTAVTFSPDADSIALISPDRLIVWRCYGCGDRARLLKEVDRRSIQWRLSAEERLRFDLADFTPAGEGGVGHSHEHEAARAH